MFSSEKVCRGNENMFCSVSHNNVFSLATNELKFTRTICSHRPQIKPTNRTDSIANVSEDLDNTSIEIRLAIRKSQIANRISLEHNIDTNFTISCNSLKTSKVFFEFIAVFIKSTGINNRHGLETKTSASQSSWTSVIIMSSPFHKFALWHNCARCLSKRLI